MSEILKRIRENLKSSMIMEIRLRKERATNSGEYEMVIVHKTVSRAIISMFPEIGKKPADATDDDTIKLLKKYIKNEKERLLYTDKHITEDMIKKLADRDIKTLAKTIIRELGDALTSPKIILAQSYLPKQATEEEIGEWIHKNIDFSIYKNKMQAMGPIMKQFKGCDGNFVKNLLIELS